MASRVYAAPEQLTAWTGRPAPADAEQLLAHASRDIDTALLTAVYSTDPAGYPTETDVGAALTDSVCAQVEHWLATGSDGVTAPDQWDSVSIGPVSLSGRGSTSSAPVTVHGVELAARAYRALHDAGLLPGVVWPEACR